MKIIQTRIFDGPNVWSMDHKLIELLIDIKEAESFDPLIYFDKNPAELDFLKKYLSKENTTAEVQYILKYLLLEICEALEISPETVYFTKNNETQQCFLAYSYGNQDLCIRAGEAAVRVAAKIINYVPHNLLAEIGELKKIKSEQKTGATSSYILAEVEKRKIPFRKFKKTSLVTLGYGKKQRKVRTAVTDATSGIGIEIAGDKEETKKFLETAHLPVPKGILVNSMDDLKVRINEIKFPFVIKPLDGNQGRGVTTNINSLEDAIPAFIKAQLISDTVIIEEYIKGDDYRFLVIDYKFVAAAKRIPASVEGDGHSTIQQLVEEANKDPNRGHGFEHVLSPIKMDASTDRILAARNLTPNSILPKGEFLALKDTANISAGGTAFDVTDLVHPENKFMAEHIAKLFNLDICGIDVMASSVHVPITHDVGAIIEVNAGPGLRMHSNPQIGTPRNVAADILNMLFKGVEDFCIPIIAFGGQVSDKTLKMISDLSMAGGYAPGYTSGSGIFIMNHRIWDGNATDHSGATDLLFDPLIDFATLTCNYRDIAMHGLPFNSCEVSVILEPEQLLVTEASETFGAIRVLARSTLKRGHCILDADNKLIAELKNELTCEVAMISLHTTNEFAKAHIKNGGRAGLKEDDRINLYFENSIIKSFRISELLPGHIERSQSFLTELISVLLISEIYRFDKADIAKIAKSIL